LRPAARLQAAIEIIDRIRQGLFPPDRILAQTWRERRYAGAKDRVAIAGLVYAVLRQWGVVAALAGPGCAARRACLALLATRRLPDVPDPAAAFAGEAYGPAALSAAEAAWVAELGAEPGSPPAWAVANLPAWLEAAYRQRFGEAFALETAALNRPAPLDLRVNGLRATREAVAAELAAAGIVASPTTYAPLGLRLPGPVRLQHLPAYRQGRVEVQDEGSQVAAALVGAAAGETVVDLCAGAGGKSLAMAAAMADRGQLHCFDTDATRLAEAAGRLARAGATLARCRPLSGDHRELAALRGRCDRVLVDAPCSGTGTGRRDPLVAWRLTPAGLTDLAALQGRLLDLAAELLRPGGQLVYVTCSVLEAENEAVVGEFLEQNRHFAPRPLAGAWQRHLHGEMPGSGRTLLLTPHRHGTDGFFVAAMGRDNASSPTA